MIAEAITVNDRPAEGTGSWVVRRRMVFGLIAFCMACILWVMLTNMKGRVAETIVLGSFGLLGSTAGFYIAGAVWQDTSTIKVDHERRRHDYRSYGGYSDHGIGED